MAAMCNKYEKPGVDTCTFISKIIGLYQNYSQDKWLSTQEQAYLEFKNIYICTIFTNISDVWDGIGNIKIEAYFHSTRCWACYAIHVESILANCERIPAPCTWPVAIGPLTHLSKSINFMIIANFFFYDNRSIFYQDFFFSNIMSCKVKFITRQFLW